MTDLTRLTLRLAPGAADALRAAAFSVRLQPAVLARLLVLQALETGELPAPAPPAPEALAKDARALLAALAASQSNLTQLLAHAAELGDPLARLAQPGGVLATLGGQLRALGLSLKAGAPAPAFAPGLHAAAGQINDLAKRLNVDRRAVPIADWHQPLTSLKTALAEVN